ncbi:Histone-lysine N-methyltransferase ASHR1 [Platanthera guangdongensis]|uniref:Histone-lysine N-methyltransferase ASHR1 n=1 Tax=Platanthera guangdongensis TaxID=2320717 RepID=A0ABR2MR22_9ASPA
MFRSPDLSFSRSAAAASIADSLSKSSLQILEQTENALKSFTEAAEILRITHGISTPFMKELFSKLEEARAEHYYKRSA